MTEQNVDPKILDELLKDAKDPAAFEAMFRSLKKSLIERALGAELSSHLGYAKGEARPEGQSNHRNGTTPKTVISDEGPIPIEVPRDRDGSFEPLLIKKGERRLEGFDEKVISMYARGMTVREIQGHLQELYGIEVSRDLISTVTDAVIEEVRDWQSWPLDPIYPVIIFDALRVKIRDEGTVKNKAVYIALGIGRDGTKDILGLWIEQTEGAKFWLKVMTELKNRGVQDVLVTLVDGLKGFPEAIATAFPQAQVQTCIVHLMRHSLDYVSWKDRKLVAVEIKGIYRAETAELALERLEEFEQKKGPGGRNTRSSLPPGAGTGNGSPHSLPIRRRCAASCTRPMPSNR